MSDTTINIGVETNAAEIVAKLETYPAEMAKAVARAFDHENELTVGEIQARKLSRRGPTTLGVRSNRLRSSMRRTEAFVQGLTVDSAIGTNVKYAAAHEFGFQGDVLVRAHRARHHALDVFSIRGRQVQGWQLPDLGGRGQRETKVASGFVLVRAHKMHMNIPARRFIRSTIEERTSIYREAVSRAIVSTWEGTN